MKKIFIAIIAVLLVGGGATYIYGSELPIFDSFYSPEQQEVRQVMRLAKEFPQSIGDYTLYGRTPEKIQVKKECLPSGGTQVCYRNITAEYRQTGGRNGVFIQVAQAANEAGDELKTLIKQQTSPATLGAYAVVRIENHELGWFPVKKYNFVLTQEGIYTTNTDGSESYTYPNKATGSNPVTSYFINAYPPATTQTEASR